MVVGELLDSKEVGRVGLTASSVLLGKRQPRKPEVGELRVQGSRILTALLVVIHGAGDLAEAELTYEPY